MDMDSVPPAMTHSAIPAMMRSAAIAMVCEPDEQKRLTVTAGTSCGSPARSAAMRATFVPDSPSGVAQPMMTSSIVFGSSPGARRSKSSMTAAAMSSGLTVRKLPRGAFPTAVRTPATITASLMYDLPFFNSISKFDSRISNSYHAFGLAAHHLFAVLVAADPRGLEMRVGRGLGQLFQRHLAAHGVAAEDGAQEAERHLPRDEVDAAADLGRERRRQQPVNHQAAPPVRLQVV